MDKYTWIGLKTIAYNKKHLSISYLGKYADGWKDYYKGTKPWKHLGYSNPIFCKSKNWGYNETLGKYRVEFCLFWHNVQWHKA